jgi:hypothetical protein
MQLCRLLAIAVDSKCAAAFLNTFALRYNVVIVGPCDEAPVGPIVRTLAVISSQRQERQTASLACFTAWGRYAAGAHKFAPQKARVF